MSLRVKGRLREDGSESEPQQDAGNVRQACCCHNRVVTGGSPAPHEPGIKATRSQARDRFVQP
jgi:hypothetical protein